MMIPRKTRITKCEGKCTCLLTQKTLTSYSNPYSRVNSDRQTGAINTSRDQLRKDIKAVLAKYRQCWQKHMIDFEEYGSAVAERTIMESVNKAVLPAVLNAAEENCVEVIESTMIRHPRGECAHRLERIIFEIWQKYLNCVRHELTGRSSSTTSRNSRTN